MDPGLIIGQITAVFNKGGISPLSKENLHNIKRGLLSSFAHSRSSLAGKLSVPGEELLLISLITSTNDSSVKCISFKLGSPFLTSVLKNSIEFDIPKFLSGREKLDENWSDRLLQMSFNVLTVSLLILNGPITFFVLRFCLVYVKKYLGFDLIFLIARVSLSNFSSL